MRVPIRIRPFRIYRVDQYDLGAKQTWRAPQKGGDDDEASLQGSNEMALQGGGGNQVSNAALQALAQCKERRLVLVSAAWWLLWRAQGPPSRRLFLSLAFIRLSLSLSLSSQLTDPAVSSFFVSALFLLPLLLTHSRHV